MPHCCVPRCRNRSETNPELSFYRFPAVEAIRKYWLTMIERANFEPTPNTRVCSWHFPHGKAAGPSRFQWTEISNSGAKPGNTCDESVRVSEIPEDEKCVSKLRARLKARKIRRKSASPVKLKAVKEMEEDNPLDLLAYAASNIDTSNSETISSMETITIVTDENCDGVEIFSVSRDVSDNSPVLVPVDTLKVVIVESSDVSTQNS